MSTIVVDASVSAVWLLEDENHPTADAAYQFLETGEVIVPQIWHFEIRNVLLTSCRRQRISTADIQTYLNLVNGLGIQTDEEPDFSETMTLALAKNLTFYDALYLELAKRRNAQLATLDRSLATAASQEGVLMPV